MHHILRVFVIPLLALSLGMQGSALAGTVGTEAMLAESAPQSEARATVDAELARQEVRSQMAAMGVDPAAVDARLAALSDDEMAELANNIESAPAGGSVIGVVGVVFVVLLILEAVGVIDVFKGI